MTSPRANRSVVVLDRDGTIVTDRHYLNDPEGLEFLPGTAEGLRSLYVNGHRLVVITNQSGVGRGLISLHQLERIHDRLTDMVRAAGARLEGIFFCPHTPDNGCDCRKPRPGLLMRASLELEFDLANTVVVGDKESDMAFGQGIGAPTILISNRPQGAATALSANFIARDLVEAAQLIQANTTIRRTDCD